MKRKTENTALIVFLLGIFMGAIDNGVVSPARTVIRTGFGVSDSLAVWMITIYTLSYAVSMPIMSKLSDRYGRKKVYTISIITFAVGSMLCGLTNFYGNFNMFLGARVIQAIGGGGIMPIATALIGNSFPEEKRGTALGLVGAIYGIATMLGPTLGSAVLNVSGQSHWGWIFFINIPISIIIILLSYTIKDSKAEKISTMDLKGCIVISIMILSLMYALTNLNFFQLKNSLQSNNVWPYLLIFILSLPIFIMVEKKAEDPILNLKYFTETKIALTLIISFIVGCGLMGVVFVPQFAENTLKLKSGSGGYLVTLMALFSGIAAPLGGKLIDKFSAKFILTIGFSCTVFGMLFLSFYATAHPGFIPALIGLAFVGLGMGFTMGTPLNYLMLSYVDSSESASALSTLSLVRSIGVAISPNIMVTFIVEAAKKMPNTIRAALPTLNPPTIPGMEHMPGKMMTMPKMNFSGNMSPEILDKFQSADVTTIVDVSKQFMANLMDKIMPNIQTNITEGIKQAMQQMQSMPGGKGIIGAMSKIDVSAALQSWKVEYLNEIEKNRVVIENVFRNTLNNGFKNMFLAAALIALTGLIITLFLPNKNKNGLN